MKKLIIFVFVLLIFLGSGITVRAVSSDTEEIFQEQLKQSGVDTLFSSLPEETKKIMIEAGITSAEMDYSDGIQLSGLLNQVRQLTEKNGSGIGSAACVCLGMLLLCALTEGLNVTLGGRSMDGVISVVGSLCVCAAAIVPVSILIHDTALLLTGTSGFMLLYVPIMAGLTAGSGYQTCASTYYGMLMGTGEIISGLAQGVLIPLMNIFLSISITSVLSSGLNLSSITKGIYQCGKWILTFSLGIFVTVLSSQTLVTSALDDVSKRTIRFTMSSFVPVVGSVLGETLNAFSGSLKLLRSGAGVFIIIAAACLFLPLLIKCILWKLSFSVLDIVSELLGVKKMKTVFSDLANIISMLIALMLSVVTVLIISTVILLLIGR